MYRLCSSPNAQIVMLLVLLAVFPLAVYRAIGDFSCDFADFVNGGQYVLDHGRRHPLTALNRYLPSLDVACIVLTLLPLGVGAAAYYLLNVGTWFALLITLRDRMLPGDDASLRERGAMAAGLLALPIAADGLVIGAFHILMLWLMLAGLVHASQGRPWKGGTLLGLAIWLKLLPVVGAGYLLVKRKWLAAALAVTVAATIDITLSLAAFGWQEGLDEHLVWLRAGAAGTVGEQMHGDSIIDEDRITNQSTMVILRRFLTTRGGFANLAVADLSPQALSIVTACVMFALGAIALALIGRSAAAQSREAWASEIALVVLCTVWFSPVVWSYHLTAAVPALAVIMGHATAEGRKRAVTAAWLLGLALFAVPLARAAGHMLWASFFVGAVLMWSMRRSRNPEPAVKPIGAEDSGLNPNSGSPPPHFQALDSHRTASHRTRNF
jgi:hypothetical protein